MNIEEQRALHVYNELRRSPKPLTISEIAERIFAESQWRVGDVGRATRDLEAEGVVAVQLRPRKAPWSPVTTYYVCGWMPGPESNRD